MPLTSFIPAYLKTFESGELRDKIETARQMMENCLMCPRNCRVNRMVEGGKLGVCRVEKDPVISSYGPHFGEEPELVGRNGSGTIFFTGCNLHCLFCQNYDISHLDHGEKVSFAHLANAMLYLQDRGCHSINFVTPTHQAYQILVALEIAIEKGLRVPLVYNCGGYEALEVIQLLEGVIDIYMPDMKYADREVAKELAKAPDYPEINRPVVKEMHRQVGDLVVNSEGIALRGLLIRHLVMPENLAGSGKTLHFIATEISKNAYVNIMDQYRPEYKACEHPKINRRITYQECDEAVRLARAEGLYRGF